MYYSIEPNSAKILDVDVQDILYKNIGIVMENDPYACILVEVTEDFEEPRIKVINKETAADPIQGYGYTWGKHWLLELEKAGCH